jgi:ABC-2 type transport system permease protein
MKVFLTLLQREFLGYFRTPIGYVFTVIFLLSSTGCMFFLGQFFETNQASLEVFFAFLPWIYLFLIPAVGMRLWAEERRSGTEELLFTFPVSIAQAVLAKFFAGWGFILLNLLLTIPLWLTVSYLGEPDHAVVLTGYLGSFLLAGSYLAISCATSAVSKNQVISFILGVLVCFVMVLLGWGVFATALGRLLPAFWVDVVSQLGFITHFQSVSRGLLDTRDLLYFFSVIAAALALNSLFLQNRRLSS